MSRLLRNLLLIATGLLILSCRRAPDVTAATLVDTPPRIDPDYTSLVIPPNIAPMNFRIKEEGRDYVVRISSDGAPPFVIHCPDGTVRIGLDKWREIFGKNKGKRLYYDIYAKRQDGRWVRFRQLTNTIAGEPIDSYIVYRLLLPNWVISEIKGIFQTNLETSERSTLITLRQGTFKCVNCHTFHQHNPDKVFLDVRMKHPGTLLVMDGKTRMINTKQSPMYRPMAFGSWHPDVLHIAATLNQFIGYTPSADRQYYFQALDKRGDLVVYNVESNTISTSKDVFENEYIETHPCWSADGKHIYFVRTSDKPLVVPDDVSKFRYDLMRIAYDTATDTWGSPETVMAYSDLGVSCAFPNASPDGRYILHIVADRTNYPMRQKSSDVYVLDVESNQTRKLDGACSDLSESYPRWSSNGRWFSFLRNRRDGMTALPYFAYFDDRGQARKAFVLPQKDPAHYDTSIQTYNVVELVKSKVDISPWKLAREMQRPPTEAVFPDPPEMDAFTGATPKAMVDSLGSTVTDYGAGQIELK